MRRLSHYESSYFSGQYGLLPKNGRTSLYERRFLFQKSGQGSTESACLRSSPIGPVEAAILDGFGDVFWRQIWGIFEISNGTSDFENPIVGAGAETLLGHGAF